MTLLVGQRRPRPQHAPRHSAPLPSFPKYPQHPNTVIPRAVAESMPLASNPHHSRSTCRTQTSSFRAQSRNPSPASQRISQRIQHPLHSTMDTATSRSMTVLCGVTVCPGTDDGVGRATASPPPTRSPSLRTPPVIPEVPAEPKLRHSARSRGIHLPRANASAREASTFCTPLWILRLRAV